MPLAPLTSVTPASGTGYIAAATPSAPAAGSGFGDVLTSAIEDVSAAQSESQRLAVAAVTGDLTDIHAATIASSRAAVSLELVAAVRNKGVEAFTEIMRMQA